MAEARYGGAVRCQERTPFYLVKHNDLIVNILISVSRSGRRNNAIGSHYWIELTLRPWCAGCSLIPSGYRQEALIPEAIADAGRVYISPARGRCETDAS